MARVGPKRLWYIHGQAYDLTPFLDRHPGGREALMMAQGLNCTELFETYHFKKTPPKELMDKYLVRDALNLNEAEKEELIEEKFTWEETGFYKTLKKRVQNYFVENKLQHKATFGYHVMFWVQMLIVIALNYPAFYLGSFFFAAFHGVFRGVTAVGCGHSISHYSLFSKNLPPSIFRITSFLVLSNQAIWSTSHVVSHHVYTLTHDDLQDNYPFKRIQPSHPWKFWHSAQHFYIWFIYLFGLPLWSMVDFIGTFPTLFTGKHEMRYFGFFRRIENTLSFALLLVWTVFLPFFFHDFWTAFALSFLSNAAASMTVVLQIVVNHEVTDTMSKVPDGKKIDWGAHQALTSHNYSIFSLFWLHYSGGLNMQVEHHLFPSIHYVHFHGIRPIVQQTCKEFGLPYNSSTSLFQALQKHYAVLKANASP